MLLTVTLLTMIFSSCTYGVQWAYGIPLCLSVYLSIRPPGADPAAGKGGPKLLINDGGSRGLAPWRGLQGGRAPLRREILNFWTQFARFGAYFLPTSYWKSLDLFAIKVFFFFFFLLNYGIGLYKNGLFIVFMLAPPRVPQGVLLRPIYYFLQVRFLKQIMQYTGAARGSIVRVKAKAGVQGAEPLGEGQGESPLKLMLFRG